jgi:hypothetical protein
MVLQVIFLLIMIKSDDLIGFDGVFSLKIGVVNQTLI